MQLYFGGSWALWADGSVGVELDDGILLKGPPPEKWPCPSPGGRAQKIADLLRLRRSPTYLPRPTDRATETDRIRQGKSRREKPARVASAVLAREAGHLALLSSGACSGEGEREE